MARVLHSHVFHALRGTRRPFFEVVFRCSGARGLGVRRLRRFGGQVPGEPWVSWGSGVKCLGVLGQLCGEAQQPDITRNPTRDLTNFGPKSCLNRPRYLPRILHFGAPGGSWGVPGGSRGGSRRVLGSPGGSRRGPVGILGESPGGPGASRGVLGPILGRLGAQDGAPNRPKTAPKTAQISARI